MEAPARLFTMGLMPHVDAVLVFDPSESVATNEYEVFSIAPSEQDRVWREWDAMRAELAPTGRIPFGDVELDEESHVIRMRTLGLERFATN
jgi:hypothetical protein